MLVGVQHSVEGLQLKPSLSDPIDIERRLSTVRTGLYCKTSAKEVQLRRNNEKRGCKKSGNTGRVLGMPLRCRKSLY
jgi:hypothetical protein